MKLLRQEQRGFALVLVLSLLAVLVLVTYAISLMSRVDTQVGTVALYQTQARQTALLGLRMALAELQVAAGPDNRLTGMAGMAGVAESDPRRQITGVWGAGASPIWLVSGNTGNDEPMLSGERIQLVGPGAVGKATDRVDQELVEAGLIKFQSGELGGRYAYWVGDEGVKVSVGVVDADAQIATDTGQPLRLDAKWILGTRYNPSTANLNKLVSLESLRYARLTGSELSLTGAFHTITARHRALPSTADEGVASAAGFVEGAFNLNTTSSDVWRGLLAYPDRNAGAHGLSATATLNNARKITALITARRAPFSSVSELVSSGLLQTAFDATPNRVTTVTAQEFIDDVAPILAVRSDTFRIRAYGDALNPADAGLTSATPEAVAYCEAIVQRTNRADPLGNGKKFMIVYFRWLGPDDV